MTTRSAEGAAGSPLGRLSDAALAKAERYMRALRRAVLSYWYATIEDQQAALIEAANACVIVNLLDEAVFEPELGEPYKSLRGTSAGGRVVTGLELIRNCETHSPVVFDDLLVEKRCYSVPLHAGAQVMRSVWHWADYVALPPAYVELQGDASEAQKRARKEAQHGYRPGVQGRSVIETLFDAERFFADIDPRLAVPPGHSLEHSFAEVPQGESVVLHRPLEGFGGTVPLPDLATRWGERTTAAKPPADQYVKDLASSKNKDLPAGDKRIITHKVSDGSRVVGYSGDVEIAPGFLMNWVERSSQIGRDIRSGFLYAVQRGSDEVPVASNDNLVLSAEDDGGDLLGGMPEAEDSRGLGRLRALEEYPDHYLSMRKGL
ncbi:hypothetical protein [Nocardioides terrisoli]|uniref:hypothetical protein n=1 Tax=Nocardioides terrisoli TaxID=3388267 RepID=UPI00287BB1A8|nr:hypothetical protein [Nocardioides marmorisolisilvae]